MGKWYSSQNMTRKSNGGIYLVGWGIGKTVYFMQHGTVKGVKGFGEVLTRFTRTTLARRSNPWSEKALWSKDTLWGSAAPWSNDGPLSDAPLSKYASWSKYAPWSDDASLRKKASWSQVAPWSKKVPWSKNVEPPGKPVPGVAQPVPAQQEKPCMAQRDRSIHDIKPLLASQNAAIRTITLREVQRYLRAQPSSDLFPSREWDGMLAEVRGLCDDDDSQVRWAALEALRLLRPAEGSAMIRMAMHTLDLYQQQRALLLLVDEQDQPPRPLTIPGATTPTNPHSKTRWPTGDAAPCGS